MNDLTRLLGGPEPALLVPGLLRHLATEPGLLARVAAVLQAPLRERLHPMTDRIEAAADDLAGRLVHAPRCTDDDLQAVFVRFARTIARMLAFSALARRALATPGSEWAAGTGG
jgi:hypothetical protein